MWARKLKLLGGSPKMLLGALRDTVCRRRFFVSNVRDYELSSTNCLLMLQNLKGLPNIIWNQRSLKSILRLCNTYVRTCISPSQASGIRAGNTQKGCGHAADVHAYFHGNLRRKTVENFGGHVSNLCQVPYISS